MAKPTLKNEIAKELCEKFPKSGTRTLARILYNENKVVFKDYEDARAAIRYVRGEHGKLSRKHSKAFKEMGKTKEYHIPETWAKPKKVFKIPSGYKNIGLISDIQCPFHDAGAIEICVKYLQDRKIDCLLINGDFLDAYHLSDFQKDPRLRNFKQEREDGIELLNWFKSQFKKIPIYYHLDANHEERYERYMRIKSPELFSTDLFHIEDLFMLHDIGIIPIRGYDHIKVGNLPILHGHTLFRGQQSPVSPARTIFMKLKQTALASHVHKVSQYTCVNLDGEVMGFWTTGCLMNLNVEYNQHGNDYVHGFAIIKILNDKGDFMVENKMIINRNVH